MRELVTKNFVPVADDHKAWQKKVYDHPELRQFVEDSGMADQPSLERAWKHLDFDERSTIIGYYAIAPSGRPLASFNKNPRTGDPEVRPMLELALERWAKLTPEERLLPSKLSSDLTRGFRWSHFIDGSRIPAGTLVLRSYTRDLPRGPLDPKVNGTYGASWTQGMWNMDAFWYETPEKLVPAGAKVGQSFDFPARFMNRLARYNLVDNVLGLTTPFAAEDVKLARLTGTVKDVSGDIVTIGLEGETNVVARGIWRQSETGGPMTGERGFETTMRGWLRWNRATGKFEQFDLVAKGRRWGSTEGNRRYDDEYPPFTDNRASSPIAVAFTLLDGNAESAVPPMMLMLYRDKYLDDV